MIISLIQRFFTETIFLFNEMAIYLLLGFFLGGLIYAFLPQHRIKSAIGTPGMFASLKAALLGVPLPLCSCGVVPTALSIRQSGATKGAVVSFLIATPQTGVDSIAATWSMLGPVFAIFRPVVAFITGTIGGFLTDLKHDSEEVKPAHVNSNGNGNGTVVERFKLAIDYGFSRLLGDIAKWVVIGILIGGLIAAVVPESFFDQTLGNPFLSYTLILLVSVPIYVCATGSIPIALAMVMKGLSPGAAFVFLMAGPATNAATFTILWKTIGRRATLMYLLTIIVGAVAGGILFDTVLAQAFYHTYTAMHHGNGLFSWVKIGGSVVLALLLLRALWPSGKKEVCEMPTNAETMNFKVLGMTCGHCKMTVENATKSVPGVEAANVVLSEKALYITGSPDPAAIKAAVEAAGYTVE